MILGGKRVIVSPPYKTFTRLTLKAKRKFGPKNQRVYRFTGWQEKMQDGEVYETPHGYIMNRATADELRRTLARTVRDRG